MNETILIKTVGGPFDGDTRVVNRAEMSWDWPPPNQILVPGEKGFYKRESYSQLPQIGHPNVMRGAQYQWVEE